MATRNFNNVTFPAAGGFLPDSTGFTDQIFNNRTSAVANVTLRNPDLNDSTLTIDFNVEITSDASGATGWAILVGRTWQGGPEGRDHTAKQPVIGPYSTTAWPDFQRMRIHVVPSRQVTGVDITASVT